MSDPFGDFDHQRKYLMGVARARGLNTMDAEDAVSSAVLSLLERYQEGGFDVLRAAGPLAVRRKILDRQRQWHAEQVREEKLRDPRSTNAAAPAEWVMLEGEDEAAVQALRAAVVASVEPPYRGIDGALFDVIVADLGPLEKSEAYREIAALFRYNPSTLKSRASKVRGRMRRIYLGGRRWRAV